MALLAQFPVTGPVRPEQLPHRALQVVEKLLNVYTIAGVLRAAYEETRRHGAPPRCRPPAKTATAGDPARCHTVAHQYCVVQGAGSGNAVPAPQHLTDQRTRYHLVHAAPQRRAAPRDEPIVSPGRAARHTTRVTRYLSSGESL
jgi:hypothetical protein